MDEPAKRFETLYDEGIALLEAGQKEAGGAKLLEACKASPAMWLGLGTELIKQGERLAGAKRMREVLAVTDNARVRSAALVNLGICCTHDGRNGDAMDLFKQAVRLWPDSPDAISNIGLMHKLAGRYAESKRWFRRALTLDPWHESAQFGLAMVELLDCNYKDGWPLYESRWRSKSNGIAKIAAPVPEWDGTSGKSLYVYGEQGHGDSILMLRFAAEIKRRGLRQSWVCQKSMAPLVRTIPDIDEACEVGENWPEFDMHIPAVSLPKVLGVTVETIPPAPYIPKPPDPVNYGPGFHVGIAWRGSSAQSNDAFRSVSLLEFAPVLAVPGVTFHSFQFENAEEVALYPQIKTYEKPSDWLESARRLCGLDLVICVDTALVHLSGALGVPCWCALHARPYFVYPPKFGAATPWYDSVRLFRQEREREWGGVFQQIGKELACLIQS